MEKDGPARTEGRAYHHGDLRNALLAAALEEIRDRGMEGFTLRGCAKRAGVSHAAPAHHFKDSNALLTELAAEGFRRFLAFQTARQNSAQPDPRSQMIAAGLGYIEFAAANPELFRLIFSSSRADFDDPTLEAAAKAAFDHLVEGVEAIGGTAGDQESRIADVMATWAIVHGLADLMMAGHMKWLAELDAQARERVLTGIVERALPKASGT